MAKTYLTLSKLLEAGAVSFQMMVFLLKGSKVVKEAMEEAKTQHFISLHEEILNQ